MGEGASGRRDELACSAYPHVRSRPIRSPVIRVCEWRAEGGALPPAKPSRGPSIRRFGEIATRARVLSIGLVPSARRRRGVAARLTRTLVIPYSVRTLYVYTIRRPRGVRSMASPPPARIPAAAAAAPSGAAAWPVIGSSQTLSQRVYEVVRDRILGDALPVRTYVREEELAMAMGVSRTPVREALSRLASEGFLDRLPHRGFRVAERSIDELTDVFVVLQSLELLACELAFPRIQASDLARLEEANAGFAAAVAANDVSTAVDRNDRFHHLLAEMSGNAVLARLLDDLRSQVHRLEVLDFSSVLVEPGPAQRGSISRETWVTQHAEFIHALHDRDHVRALDILRANRSFVFRRKVDEARANSRTPVWQGTA